jgi:hypothetical protein
MATEFGRIWLFLIDSTNRFWHTIYSIANLSDGISLGDFADRSGAGGLGVRMSLACLAIG